MDGLNNGVTAEAIDVLIQGAYQTYVNDLVSGSAFALLLYTTILKLPEEKEYIWLRRFHLPTWLYISTRYGSLIQQGHVIAYNLVPSISTMSCNIINYMQLFWFVVSFTGTQGLLIARAYSLCNGNKVLAGILAIGFALGLILSVISLVPFSYCATDTALTVLQTLASFLQNLFVILTDLVIFAICVRETWGVWKLQRNLSIRSPSDLISTLLRQSISRSGFVISTSVSLGVFALISRNSKLSLFVLDIGNILQNSLSAILVADFTLDLRRRNSASIDASNVTVPTPQNFLQHLHQSFLFEMRIPEDMPEPEGKIGNDDTESSERSQQSEDVVAIEGV